MSTDRTGRRMQRFRRTSTATLTVLALVATGLGVAAVVRGPRLDSGSINAQAAISRPEQRLQLQADQAIQPVTAEQVVVTPEVPFTVESDGASVTLTFEHMLDYATDYAVSVDGATSSSTGRAGTLDYEFRTPDVDVYTLLRRGGSDAGADKPADQILRSTLAADAGPSSTVVLEAPRIQQFAVVGDSIGIIQVDDAGDTSFAVSTAGSRAQVVPTPSGGRVQNLHAATGPGLFGFTVNGGTDGTGRVYQNTLFVFDPLSASGRAEEVSGFDGAPLRVVDWAFVPGTSSVVAQSTDQQLYLLDALDAGAAARADGAGAGAGAGTGAGTGAPASEPVPLGRHGELREFLDGGLTLVVADPAGASTIDLSTGEVTPFEQATPEVDPTLYPGTIVTLGDGVTLRQYDEVDYSSATPVRGSVILRADASGTRELYRSTTPGSRVRSFCVSPNGQYLAVETIASTAVNDGYALPGYSDMTTTFVQIATGTATRAVPGFLPDWCQ